MEITRVFDILDLYKSDFITLCATSKTEPHPKE